MESQNILCSNQPLLLSPDECEIIIFDVETTGLSNTDEIVQISAISLHESIFNSYIIPSVSMSKGASIVTGVSVIDGDLFLNEERLEASSAADAVNLFIQYIKTFEKQEILLAHNGNRFDTPRLLKLVKEVGKLDEFCEYVTGFADSLPIFRKVLLERTETALIYDAVHLFAMALHVLDTSQQIDVKPLSCDSTDTWDHGYSLINYMKNVEMTGLTGTIKFDNQGFRSDFTLEIMELNTKNGLEEIGSWNSSFGINFTRSFREVYTQMIDSLQNKSFIVTTILSAPYCMWKESSKRLAGNAQFEGYSIDLIHEISKILGFNYTIQLVPDGLYGSLNRETREWDGMIKELLDQKADLAIADLTITYDREQAVDFTMPFMNLVFQRKVPSNAALLLRQKVRNEPSSRLQPAKEYRRQPTTSPGKRHRRQPTTPSS
ncbi:glutamate receptor ionotropic, kainate 1-like [Trichogramma pretiosum]|uniref:glutamate receptor ionotropic, kainate 1-like n=1 Tax=Trichogramma pretiosum TaxID=7493 RepID=UPI000C71B902|nr:glutamate receptor ionotropic, kainate 1-like [Trichogramma pretiosum]